MVFCDCRLLGYYLLQTQVYNMFRFQESGSLYSNTGSEASTEPWFCEPCMAGVKSPHCEVCPRVGGIYKETDVGNWIHLVCALYIPQISFFDQDRITKATLFELNYQVD